MAMKKCPVCGVSVKDENLLRHVRNQHPHDKVEGLEDLRPARTRPRRDWKDDVARVGTVLAVAGIVWLVLALLFPAPIGVIVPAFPHLAVLVLVGVGLLSVGWVLGSTSLQRSGAKLAAVGVVLGLVFAGSTVFLAAQEGIPTLDRSPVSVAQGWVKANNAVWKSGALPVLFYYGSAGCPYCAASSWALYEALLQFGSVTGYTYTTSDPNDVYPNTPAIDLAHASLSSSYISMDVKAGDNNLQISVPPLSPVESAYVTTYNPSSSLPFYSAGGIYFRVGTLVDPSLYASGGVPLTPTEVLQVLSSQSGTLYQAIHQAQVYVEAYLVLVCRAAAIEPPPAVLADPAVTAALSAIG